MAEMKEILKKSKKAIDELEERVDDMTEELSEEAKAFWGDLKKNMSAIGDKLKDAVSEQKEELETKLDVMEAREKLETLKESAEAFTKKVAQKADAELDISALRVHLAKMEAEDFWEEKRKELSREFQESKFELEKKVKTAAEEVESFFENLVKNFTEKKA